MAGKVKETRDLGLGSTGFTKLFLLSYLWVICRSSKQNCPANVQQKDVKKCSEFSKFKVYWRPGGLKYNYLRQFLKAPEGANKKVD